MRCFLAVSFPEEVTRAYRALYEKARAVHPRVRWVRPENLHVTLRFLGETSPDAVEALHREVAGRLERETTFDLTIGSPGHFPDRSGAPRVLWVGIEAGRAQLQRMAREAESAARRCGFSRERRPWRPHLTVGRAANRGPPSIAASDWERLGCESELAGLTTRVENVALLRSDLRPEGPLYSLVWAVPLEGASGSQAGSQE